MLRNQQEARVGWVSYIVIRTYYAIIKALILAKGSGVMPEIRPIAEAQIKNGGPLLDAEEVFAKMKKKHGRE